MGLGSFIYRATGNIKDGIAGGIYHGTGSLKDGAGDLWNDATGKTASRNAARAQLQAADKAGNVQKEIYDKSVALNEPWRQAGISALSDLSGGINSGAFDVKEEQFNTPEFNFQADPGYQFRLQQQQQAIERSAAAGGGLFSGATLSDLAAKSGQMASDEYSNASDRYSKNRNFEYNKFADTQNARRASMQDRFSRLSTLAGLGENATSRLGGIGQAYGNNMTDLITGAGNAKASGIVGGYNTQRDTLMGLGNLAVKTGTAIAGGG